MTATTDDRPADPDDAVPRWHPATVALHWLTVLLVGAQFLIATPMLDETRDLVSRFELYQWHKSIGLSVAAIVAARLVLRSLRPAPPHVPARPLWERIAAGTVHAALYGCLVAMPVTGFLMVSAAPLQVPTLLFGLVEIPHPIGPDKALYERMLAWHDAASTWLLWLALAPAGKDWA